MDVDMDQYRQVFIEEARELLQSLTDSLLLLEKEATDLAPVEECFRVAHSLKGMAATMGYDDISTLTHKMENFLDGVRKRERIASSDDIDLLLRCCDALQSSVEKLAGEAVEDVDLQALTAGLESAATAVVEAPAGSQASLESRHGKHYEILVRLEDGCVLKSVRAYMAFKRLNMMGEIEKTEPSMHDIEDEKFDREFTVYFSSSAEPGKIREAVLAVSEVASATIAEAGHEEEKVEQETAASSHAGEERAPP